MPIPPAADGALLWEHATWPDLTYLAEDPDGDVAEVGLVPVGATEQHGPHLPTNTDTLIATELCRRVSARTAAPVLPAISVGCSLGHGFGAWPGTISLSPEQLTGLCVTWAEWAALSGLRRLLFVNAHFGNSAAVSVAVDRLRFSRPDLRAGLVDWWTADPEVAAALGGDGVDLHANKGETSVMLALAPELVATDRIADADDEDRTLDLVFTYTVPASSTNGVTGRPSEATVELGQQLVDGAVTAISSLIERGRKETPPLGVPEGPNQTAVTLWR